MTIGEQIKSLRKQQGLTQKALSELTEIPVRTIQQYEAGTFKPKQRNLEKLAEAFDIPIEQLVLQSYADSIKIFESSPEEMETLFKKIFSDPKATKQFTNLLMKELVVRNISEPSDDLLVSYASYLLAQNRLKNSRLYKYFPEFMSYAMNLNEIGLQKLLEYAQDLASMEKYTKPDPEE